MGELPMTIEDRERFLAEPHVAVLAVGRPPATPIAVPIWYAYELSGLVTIHTAKGQLKTRALEEAGAFTLCVQVPKPPYRYVTVAGPIVAIEPIPLDERRAMVHRYFDHDRAEAYLARTAAKADFDLAVRMRPDSWWSADFSSVD